MASPKIEADGTRTYGQINYNDGVWVLSNFPGYISIKLKANFPRIPAGAVDLFEMRDFPGLASDLIWFFTRWPFRMPGQTRQALEGLTAAHDKAQEELATIAAPGWQPSERIAFREGVAPYPYQAQAAEVLSRRRSLLLADEVGLGKTASAIASIVRTQALPVVVVCPPHLDTQWQKEITRFTELSTHIIKGTKPYELPVADTYILPYSRLAAWSDYLGDARFKMVVFDEAHELRRGTDSAKGRAASGLAASCDYRIGLTATPVFNYGDEIFNILQIIEPGCLGSLFQFRLEWCDLRSSDKWLVRDPEALGEYLRDEHLLLRRTEQDVAQQLPPPNILMHHVPYEERVIDDIREEARVLAQSVLSGSFTERGQAARELDLRMRRATGLAKAKSVAAYVQMLIESGQTVLLAGWHRDVYDIWKDALKEHSPLFYTGSETAAQKARHKEALLAGKSKLLIMSLRSGVGLDGLQGVCSTCVIGEFDWSPKVHHQLIGRLRRVGQSEPVDVIYCHTNGGSDPVLIEMLGLKESQALGITDPGKGAPMKTTDPDRMKRLARMVLETSDE